MARRRVKLAAAALASCLAVTALPGSAEAQFFGNWGGWDNGGTWDGLSPQQVRRAIAERGFRVLAPLRRNGSVFVADVVDARGRRERLIVAAADAEILQRFLLDDGRAPRAFARGGDDRDGLVPPADIPDPGRRFSRPADRDAPQQRFGSVAPDDGDEGGTAILPTPPLVQRPAPPIRTVKPRPHVADRSPDVAAPDREPGAVEATPLAPAPSRRVIATPAPAAAPAQPPATASVPQPAAAAPATPKAPPPATVASRPVPAETPPAAQAPKAPPPAAVASRPVPAETPPAAQARRSTDPLAIPGSAAADQRPVRSVSGGITGAPAAPSSSKPADVPVAPLD